MRQSRRARAIGRACATSCAPTKAAPRQDQPVPLAMDQHAHLSATPAWTVRQRRPGGLRAVGPGEGCVAGVHQPRLEYEPDARQQTALANDRARVETEMAKAARLRELRLAGTANRKSPPARFPGRPASAAIGRGGGSAWSARTACRRSSKETLSGHQFSWRRLSL
jgi:hypothetical protein